MQKLVTRGASGNAVLSIQPASQTLTVGGSGTINVLVAPNSEPVNAIEIVLNYNSAVMQITNIVPGPFFTDPAGSVGQPVEIIKTYANGQIHYAVGFPLGSKYSSTVNKSGAIISFITKNQGCANINFVVSTQPNALSTIVSDINAVNVLGSTVNGIIGSGITCGTTVVPSLSLAPLYRGDADGDGNVDEADYSIWKVNYNTATTEGPGKGDFNSDRTVNGLDYIFWLLTFKT